MYGKVIRSSDPKSCVVESEIAAKTEAGADNAEAEAEEEDLTEDDKTAVEEIRNLSGRKTMFAARAPSSRLRHRR